MADNFVRYVYRGADGERIPRHATHIFVDVKVIPARAFFRHPNIIEVICHEDVEKIEDGAFYRCPSLRRVIMPGVKIVGRWAFRECYSLADVECGKLERIREKAFFDCTSLRSINLPSAELVDKWALSSCKTLTDAKFGNKLGQIEELVFYNCRSLKRITIPLKDGVITSDDIFSGCGNLKQVDLVEGVQLQETIAALQLEEWRKDMNEEIDAINQILPTAPAGGWDVNDFEIDGGGKAVVIRRWIRSVLRKIILYKAEHQCIVDEAATTLVGLALPRDIVMNSVLSFLALPSHTFEGEGQETIMATRMRRDIGI